MASTNYPATPKWTVMVFMGAATIEGEAPLVDAARDDLEEMRFVGSDSALLDIFVQIHQGADVPARRGRITEDFPKDINDLEEVGIGRADLAQGQALESFIATSLQASQFTGSPNHYTMLVLWGHAYDFAIGRSHSSDGTVDALDFAELSQVLRNLQVKSGAPGGKLDILACDACDLATVEMACQIEPFAKYLLCSQIGVPIPGWPYDRILHRLRHPVGEVMNPVEFGSWAVRRFCEAYNAQARTVSLTLLDLNRAEELLERAKRLALVLASAIGDPDVRDLVSQVFVESQTGPGNPYVDVADLCWNLVRSSDDDRVIDAARALGDFLIDPQGSSGSPMAGTRAVKRPFVMEHGRNSCETARLNGVSIYAPHVVPDIDFTGARNQYENFVFTQRTRWSELVHVLADVS